MDTPNNLLQSIRFLNTEKVRWMVENKVKVTLCVDAEFIEIEGDELSDGEIMQAVCESICDGLYDDNFVITRAKYAP